MGKSIVTIHDNEGRVGTVLIAEGFGRRHEQVVRLVKKYRPKFEGLGSLPVLTTKGRTKNFEEFFLNYKQVDFLISIMQNSDVVVALKFDLITNSSVAAALDLLSNFDFTSVSKRYVYAAVDESGRVKIGISNNPEKRVQNLNIGNAETLTLVMTRLATGKGYSDEVQLHKKYRQFKIRSEWFTEGVLEDIR